MLIAEQPILTEEKISDLRSRFTLEPLEPGSGYTLGNFLCRTLLSPIPGIVAMSIRIDGVPHEFRTIRGVKKDVAEIILNIKQIILSSENNEPVVMYLRKAGPGEVLVSDITPPAGVEIHSPDLHLATLSKKGKLEIESTVERGRGYMSVAQNKDPQAEISCIPIDPTYSPVVEVTYKVEVTCVRQHTDFNRLVIGVETKPAIIPCDVLASVGKMLMELPGLMRELNEEAEGVEVGPSTTDTTLAADLALPIENLNLQSCSHNVLRRRGILTVGEPVAYPEADPFDIRNFGTESIEEIKESLAALGMTLKDPVMSSFGNSESAAILPDDQPI